MKIFVLDHQNWLIQINLFFGHFRVFAFDARGHGESDAVGATDDQDLSCFVRDEIAVAEELCRQCDVPRIAFGIGSSYGGVVTALAEASRPGLFARIALLDHLL